ncbi:hypothetical protein [Candidatus Methanodesulfokora washburnensis]|uniref:PD-(D/E)XK endonuclease-like domain-containing protein n=1 Tax=Candidatus Methanodesulfokora washburnensis TaxID=2478471 RepID=A0A429GFF0_9CREN|nr:hypothetical protein [Candidatus Methanodesulfokores washburnensis]RSN72498.1 hypothetical protein D6D85_13595 [Candidatus Methanodesulfokores washburnensis]
MKKENLNLIARLVDEIFLDPRALKLAIEVLNEEKREAGLSPSDLYYIGMADTASWWWCARKSILANKKMEPEFFLAHLSDRIEYSMILEYLPVESRSLEDIVPRLPELKWEDIEHVLKIKSEDLQEISDEEVDLLALMEGDTEAKREGIRAHYRIAEQYPTIRWAFRWRDFMVAGVPDGITDSFVYEFKTTKDKFLLNYMKPVAFTQADLYAHFFRRPLKRVQIYLRETGEMLTWTEAADEENARTTLEKFREAVRENKAPKMPASWKCRKCEFKQECISSFD